MICFIVACQLKELMQRLYDVGCVSRLTTLGSEIFTLSVMLNGYSHDPYCVTCIRF